MSHNATTMVLLFLLAFASESFSKPCYIKTKLPQQKDSNNSVNKTTSTSIEDNLETLKIARLKKEAGLCRAAIPSYHFSISSNSCEKFTYGGCNGNKNRFGDEKACAQFMTKVNSAVEWHISTSKLKKLTGPCEALTRNYYFDQTLRQCKQFNYGGCQGNANNFKEEKSCLQFAKNVKAAIELMSKK